MTNICFSEFPDDVNANASPSSALKEGTEAVFSFPQKMINYFKMFIGGR